MLIKKYFNFRKKCHAVYFASNHKFVRAISVCKSDSGFVLEQSHLEAVVGSVFVVWLVEGPGEVVREGEDVGPRAPAPLTLAPFLRRSRPVVEVVGPISYIKIKCLSKIVDFGCAPVA